MDFCDFRRVFFAIFAVFSAIIRGRFSQNRRLVEAKFPSRQTPAVTKPPVGKGEPPTTKETAVLTFKKGNPANFGENGPFCRAIAGARHFLDEKVAVARPRARLGASTAITKKKWCLYARCVKFYTVWPFF